MILDSLALKFIRRDARPRGRRGTKAAGFVTLHPLGDGILAIRMGPAHQNSDRTAPSNDLLGFSRRGGQYADRSNAQQKQLRIAAAVALQRFAYLQVQDHSCRSLVVSPPTTQPCVHVIQGARGYCGYVVGA